MMLVGKTQAQVDADKAEKARLAEITEMEGYLNSTDWYATRLAETGKVIPDVIVIQRNTARARISELRAKE